MAFYLGADGIDVLHEADVGLDEGVFAIWVDFSKVLELGSEFRATATDDNGTTVRDVFCERLERCEADAVRCAYEDGCE